MTSSKDLNYRLQCVKMLRVSMHTATARRAAEWNQDFPETWGEASPTHPVVKTTSCSGAARSQLHGRKIQCVWRVTSRCRRVDKSSETSASDNLIKLLSFAEKKMQQLSYTGFYLISVFFSFKFPGFLKKKKNLSFIWRSAAADSIRDASMCLRKWLKWASPLLSQSEVN